jgi:hypothetical protein
LWTAVDERTSEFCLFIFPCSFFGRSGRCNLVRNGVPQAWPRYVTPGWKQINGFSAWGQH